jgi:N-acetylglucosamine malate deacetylase 1
MTEPLDLLVFAPHPDDAEIGAGGIIAKLCREGKRVGIADMTQGEWGTKGDAKTRMREAEEASKILGLSERVCLGLPDGRLVPSIEQRTKVAECIIYLKPQLVLAPADDPHPDHCAAQRLVRDAVLIARLPKSDPSGHWSVKRLAFYGIHADQSPDLLVDISRDLDTKIASIEVYRSQFDNPQLPDGYTYLATEDQVGRARNRALYYGQMVNRAAAEALWLETPPVCDDPLGLLLATPEQ